MNKWLKVSFIASLLIGAGYLFGRSCIEIHFAHQLLFLPSKELLNLLLKFLLAVGACMIAAGLAAILIRPLWMGTVAFMLSAIALLLSWQITLITSLLVLIYILASTVYVRGVAKDLNERIRFSMQSVTVGQNILTMSLALIACGSFYLGYKQHIDQAGFSIPEPFMELFFRQIEEQFETSVLKEESSATITQLKEDLKVRIEEMIYQQLAPYEEFIPLGIAAGLFMSLVTILGLLTLLPNAILGLIISTLKAVGFVQIERMTQEVQSLVLE